MAIHYTCKPFDNFDAFSECYPAEAADLLETLGLTRDDITNNKPEWVDNELIYYPTIRDYGAYEYIDGWYTMFRYNDGFRGAPDPSDFIDFHQLGEACIKCVDPTGTVRVGNGAVTTTYGW